MTTTVYFNGAFLPKDEVRISPDDRGFLFADGVYEVARAYGGRFFELDAHLHRLANGLAALEIMGADAHALGEVFTKLLAVNGLSEIRRPRCTRRSHARRGAAHALVPDDAGPPTVYMPNSAVRGARTQGRRRDHHRTGHPVVRCDIKAVALLPTAWPIKRTSRGALEAVFVGTASPSSDLEQASSRWWTARSGRPRLQLHPPSISARWSCLCDQAGLPHRRPRVRGGPAARHGAVLASTTLEVMPIVQVDGRPVRDGVPGPVATRLHGMFRAAAARPR
jgi:D-alanine transaminase